MIKARLFIGERLEKIKQAGEVGNHSAAPSGEPHIASSKSWVKHVYRPH
jgi:hypothetical protein